MTDQNKSISNVAVVGLGKLGLTLAAVFASKHFNVYGADIDRSVATSVNLGKSHILNEPGLDKLVSDAKNNQRLSATTSASDATARSDVIVVIVPLITDEENNIDYQNIDYAVAEVARGLKQGALVIFETTLPPGDTRNRFGKMIEKISGLRPGKDFDLVYSPERVYSNQIIHDLEHYPKIIGGINQKSLERANVFYDKALGCSVMEVHSLETAEFSKVAECVYRDVNIALVNELAMFSEDKGVNMEEVIQASNSQPYSNIHKPGIGVGGHCIPIYPYFFINKGLSEGITPLSRHINDHMTDYAIAKTEKRVGPLNGKNILILGLSYRGKVKEPTKSTALRLIDQIQKKEANPFINDPLFSDHEIIKYGATPLRLNDQQCSEIDIVILQAFHEEYNEIDFSKFTGCKLILDGRNKLPENAISQLGIIYEGIGNGGGMVY